MIQTIGCPTLNNQSHGNGNPIKRRGNRIPKTFIASSAPATTPCASALRLATRKSATAAALPATGGSRPALAVPTGPRRPAGRTPPAGTCPPPVAYPQPPRGPGQLRDGFFRCPASTWRNARRARDLPGLTPGDSRRALFCRRFAARRCRLFTAPESATRAPGR